MKNKKQQKLKEMPNFNILLNPISSLCIILVCCINSGLMSPNIKSFEISGNIKTDKKEFYIISEYMDSIPIQKKLSYFALKKICMQNIALLITPDSLYRFGNVRWGDKMTYNLSNDSIVIRDLNFGNKLTFIYTDFGLKCIDSNSRELYIFKKVTDSLTLSHLMNGEKTHFKRYIYNQVCKIICGDYESMDKKSPKLRISLSNNGDIKGFKNFSKFSIHDYLGTYNPYSDLDILILEDENNLRQIYNWKFEGDILILTKMKLENETYRLTKEHHKYKKII